MSQSPPTTIGKYQIIREIARSNDIVYEAYDPAMNRRVAVKELAMVPGATDTQRQERLQRFLREARAAGSLQHPHIVTVYEVGQDASGRHFIAMEYLEGQTLRNLIDSSGAMKPKDAVHLAEQVLEGLAFAHGRGVIHRDIKPDNIQILPGNRVVITDFGIARLTFEPNITMDGQVFGTPSYMSPEQIHGGDLDVSSDLFSLAIILYEMVSGRKPFAGDNVVAIAYAIANANPPMPADCPPALWRVIEKALQKTSALRYRGAEEMLRDLKAAEGSLNQPVVPPPVSASSHILAGPHQNPATAHLVPPPISTAGLTPAQAQLMNQVYGQAYGQSAASPAPQSSPYGQGYGQPYGQTPTYVPVPIYYPPPPRNISLSPETKSCMGRFMWAVAIIGLLFALVIYGIGALTETMDRNPGAAQSIPTTPQQAQARLEPSLDAARERAERIITPPPAGREQELSGPTLQDAVGLVAAAMDEPNPARRAQLWSQSSQAFVAVGMSNPEGMDIVFAQAASVYMGAAEMGAQAGRFDRAIEALYQAEGFANGNQDTAYEIQQRMNLYRTQM